MTDIKQGDLVISKTKRFGLKYGKKYKVLQVHGNDVITIEIDGVEYSYNIAFFRNKCK